MVIWWRIDTALILFPNEEHPPQRCSVSPFYHLHGLWLGSRNECDRFRCGRESRLQRNDRYEGHLRDRKTQDRKSTRLNSSHMSISYAVFCLKKKKTNA